MTDIQEFMEAKFYQPIEGEAMTYAEKKAQAYAKEYCLAHSIVAIEKLEAIINQAQQAQREACLQNSIQAQKERFGLEHDDMSDWVKQAILTAEVQP